ncbi:class I SAM-dependent methyltransferase [Methanococcoides sp. NM1]|uniref:class I SAM-dependent methyltransferase n=1 Tax=Methanococcoides sp. NM1 TaxID=1201013 RepID=UPI001082BE94|nr:class I SAM-dependent methyltransferase [Methanococcoides sp. NM1]
MNTKEIIADYWDHRSSSYKNGVNGFDEEERSLWRTILRNHTGDRTGLKILDIGTGAGFLALLLAEMGHEVTAIDISRSMLEKAGQNAKSLGLDINFCHGDAEDLPFEDDHFDIVVSKYLLWTLPHPDRTVQEWKRVLKINGRILAIDGNWFDSRLDIRIKRGFSKIMTLLVEKGYYCHLFQRCYGPIRRYLPLYEDINPHNVSALFDRAGFTSTTIDPLREVHKYQKSQLPLSRKFIYTSSIFLIMGEKEGR